MSFLLNLFRMRLISFNKLSVTLRPWFGNRGMRGHGSKTPLWLLRDEMRLARPRLAYAAN